MCCQARVAYNRLMIQTDSEHAQVVRLEGLLRRATDSLDTSPYQGERVWREFLVANHRGQQEALRRDLTEYERLRRKAGLRAATLPALGVQQAKIRKVEQQIKVIERSFASIFTVVQQLEAEHPINVVKLAGARDELALHTELLAAWQDHRELLEHDLPVKQAAG
jgi:hypothetical protein